MSQLAVASYLVLFVGVTLLLSLTRWFGRAAIVERLRPYTPGGASVAGRQGLLSAESFREVIGPVSVGIGEGLARLFGVSEDLRTKLYRINSPLSPAEFRTRQLCVTLLGFVAAVCASALVGLGATITTVVAVGAALLVFLVLEQQVISASELRQRRLLQELPVVAEQLGMLLGSGYSLGGALQRIAQRGRGVIAEDLNAVLSRTRQGLTEAEALAEWADLAKVEALNRLVAVLSLNNEAADLGGLIGEEARAIRRDAHRELLASIEKKDQQVWIPVAIAALVPGSILIAIPFIQAMQTFGGG